MQFRHKNLAGGKWRDFSLVEQMGNIGSEVSRALRWKDKDQKIFENAMFRALELFDLTIQDSRWRWRLKELIRARELLCDAFFGGVRYGSSLEDLERYFFTFAVGAGIYRYNHEKKQD